MRRRTLIIAVPLCLLTLAAASQEAPVKMVATIAVEGAFAELAQSSPESGNRHKLSSFRVEGGSFFTGTKVRYPRVSSPDDPPAPTCLYHGKPKVPVPPAKGLATGEGWSRRLTMRQVRNAA